MSTALAHVSFAIAAVLFDSLWEGALIVGAVCLGLRCLPKLGAATRYAIWLCALAALVGTPVLTVGLAAQLSDTPNAVAAGTEPFGAPAAAIAPPRNLTVRAARPMPVAVESTSALPAAPKSRITIPQSLAVGFALVWILVAVARGIVLLLNVRALAVIRRDARLWSEAYDYPVFLSDRVRVPLATGFMRAAIILPAPLIDELSADAVETIVIHEVAHLRRCDVWTNALARVAEALVAHNPAAWFVMGRLAIEREIACDDWVVARTGAGDAFAQTLATLATRTGFRGSTVAPSVLGSRHAVVVRIERLLDARPRRLLPSPSALGGALMVLALIAFVAQSVSPVLAFEPPRQSTIAQSAPAARGANACTVPNRAIAMESFFGMKMWHRAARTKGHALHGARAGFGELAEPSKLVSEFGAAKVATFDLTVDAAGRPRKVVVLSTPPYPGMAEHVKRVMMESSYLPALHDCVPVSSTIRTALRFEAPRDNAYSIVVPAYPSGWSAQTKSACKVPTLQHSGVPAFPASMQNMPVDASYSAAIRVHVGTNGQVTNAAVVTSSGKPDLDSALLDVARQATYPLTESTGFKHARPSDAPLSWNAAHGSATYAACKPLPTDYVWNTTFEKVVPIGLPGSGYVVQH
ncbi:MAG: hypothetical protein NVS3B7_14410 [Candidatus Elarobacter sp.]